MTSAPILLILDDERYWLERHYQFFRKHNFTCVPTLFAEHAIHLGTKLKDINCAIIDHILYDPTQPKDERENQRWQGKDVILEIKETCPDTKFAIITQAVSRHNSIEDLGFLEGLESLNRRLYCKDQFEENPDKTYHLIETFFKPPQREAPRSKGKTISIWVAQPTHHSLPRLNLGQEVRQIKERLENSKELKFFYRLNLAVGINDLQQLLQDEPEIIHFCGHGAGEGGLILQDYIGQPEFISIQALANKFKLYSSKVYCVVLNACYTEKLAGAIANHVKYVIGMRDAMSDKASERFARGFYGALTAGKSLRDCYECGCDSIADHNNKAESDIPILFIDGKAYKS